MTSQTPTDNFLYGEGMNLALQALKKELKLSIGTVPGVQGLGMGDNHLIIYVDLDENVEKLPKTFRGVRVEAVVTGSLRSQVSQNPTTRKG